ncbi:LIMLP_19325 family protein [Leptospira santarosai]|uniref:Toxin-antitoxin system, antitoxin component, ribbon-helix-helix domain protein n=4 Tax=Leptospira santarosai TaxID=28183 RepID=A0AB73M5G7_9LEPT|nr:hypothetical protein [Leptospira santarosai]ASV11789.1 hypothetical protein B2G51_08660 [Leptospira santarosai]AVV80630.1 Uncharacterized protein XB15_02886 [Leptospira santarosai]EKO33418.1 hypothetical protein LEP1GSC179_2506 [Leptospira santarosai str. MOR084]EKR92291.1 hypothetical protein LEP1GSC163_2722 [Leptospira santarosai str. CBC379]EKS08944.1 hypothetical protein LEP1GSC071_0198 [Leptospira santarosai str. JET]
MVINYFKIQPLEITESELDEYEKHLGIPLHKEDREAILKSTEFRRALAIKNKLRLKISTNRLLQDDSKTMNRNK